jgi:hypothetical protein
MNDKSIKIVEALAIFATICYIIITVVSHIIRSRGPNNIFVLWFFTCDEVIPTQSLFSNFVFDVVVYVLYCRLKTLNKLIGQLDELSDALAFKIRRIRELHTGKFMKILSII